MQNAIVLTSATLGLTQACKIAGLPNRYSPIVAIIVGMILHLALAGLSAESAVKGNKTPIEIVKGLKIDLRTSKRMERLKIGKGAIGTIANL